MNYLAHAYLSFRDPQILVGNMISDFVKGREKFSFDGNIFHGIDLHRQIDAFTDTHPATARAKEIFRPHYRLYSGAVMDVVYDHFLAADPKEFSDESLLRFSAEVYEQLETHAAGLPPRFLSMFPYMRMQNWLYGYRRREGLARSLEGLVRRAAYLRESRTAMDLVDRNYEALKDCYENFFPEVKRFAKQTVHLLVMKNGGSTADGE